MKALPHSLNTYNFFSILICKCPVKPDIWEIFLCEWPEMWLQGTEIQNCLCVNGSFLQLSHVRKWGMWGNHSSLSFHLNPIYRRNSCRTNVCAHRKYFVSGFSEFVYLYTERWDLTHESFILYPYLCINSRGCNCRSMFFSDTQGFCLNRRLLTCNQ